MVLLFCVGGFFISLSVLPLIEALINDMSNYKAPGLMFEMAEAVSLDRNLPLSSQVWARRQTRKHQYTPPVFNRHAADTLFTSGVVPCTTSREATMTTRSRVEEEVDSFSAQPNNNIPLVLPASHKRLLWEKKCHQVVMSTFSDKVTGAPAPQMRVAMEELFSSSGVSRREVSHASLRKRVLCHQVNL